jgi:serine/threonine-protein kinase RsbW
VRVEATFRGRLPAFAEVRVWAEAFGAAVGSDRGTVLRLVLVLEELFTNTVIHGYAGGGGEGPIRIGLASQSGSIEVTYEDAAPAFDPFTAIPDARPVEGPPAETSGGLGLALVRGLCVATRYARVDDRNLLILTLPPDDTATARPGAS